MRNMFGYFMNSITASENYMTYLLYLPVCINERSFNEGINTGLSPSNTKECYINYSYIQIKYMSFG